MIRIGCVLALLVLGCAPLAAQTVYDLEIRGQGFRRITIQLPDPTIEGDAAAKQGVIRDAQETLARDLVYSGLFFVMDDYASPILPRGVSRAWNSNNERPGQKPYRVLANWKGTGSGWIGELRLLDAAGLQVLGKRYEVADAEVRGVMHHFADEIVLQLTGVPGNAQTQIAFARMSSPQSEIHVIDYDGMNERALTAQRSLSLSPCWGTGRAWLAFTSFVAEQPALYRLDQGSQRLRVLSSRPGLNAAPDWSEKAKAFAMTLSHEGNAEIYRLDSNGGNLKRLTHHPAIDTSPSWSATGQQIVFTSDRSGVPQIYVMDADGGNVRRVTDHNLYSDSPAWSPDGRWIAYVCRREGTLQLAVLRPDGSGERVVVRDGHNDGPSWSSNSRHLAFSSRRHGVRSIYVVDLYSGLERRLTSGPLEAITPAWSSE